MNGLMFDPEMIRLAQEQMSRMSPDDLSRMRQMMMSNPDLVKMANEGLKDMRPEDFRRASEKLKNTRPEDMAEMTEKMASASPEEIAAMRTHADAEAAYTLSAAELLKKQGNNLHGQGKFRDAAQKYILAKDKLRDLLPSQTRSLSLACSVNLMSCYLKTGQYKECIKEGTEVLAYDEENVKALYRRGQAYHETGDLQAAVSDLTKAHELSPDDETIADVLRNVKEKYGEGRFRHVSKGLIIEEIVDDEADNISASTEAAEQLKTIAEGSKSGNESVDEHNADVAYSVNSKKDVGEAMRSSENFPSAEVVNKMPADRVQKKDENVNSSKDKGPCRAANPFNNQSPEMIKSVSEQISKMAPDELQKMLEMASSSMGGGMGNNQMPQMSPDMIRTASQMFSKMPPEQLEKMFEVAAALKSSDSQARIDTDFGESSSGNSVSGLRARTASTTQSFPTAPSDVQEQMRNAMKDPEMNQMVSSFMKNMSPEMMVNMSQSLGMNLTPEHAAQAQKAMSSISADDLDRLMKWIGHIQRTVEGARKAKNWLLGKPGMIFAICMLILAFILHKLGFIG